VVSAPGAPAPEARPVNGPQEQRAVDAARFPRVSGDAGEIAFRTTPSGRYTYVSRNVRAILGFEPEELVTQAPLQTVHPDDVSRLVAAGERLAAGSSGETVQVRKRHARGFDVWLEVHISAVRDRGTNAVLEIEGTARDVTKQVETERALRQRVSAEALIASVSRELLSVTADETDAVVVRSLERAARFVGADRASVVVLRDRWAVRTHQWASEPEFETTETQIPLTTLPWLVEQCQSGEVVFARSLDSLPRDASAERKAFEEAGVRSFACLPITTEHHLTSGLAFNWRRSEADDCAPALSVLQVLGDVLVVALDRKETEEALRQSEERFRALVQHTSEMIAMPKPHGFVTYAKPRLEQLIVTPTFHSVFQPVVDLMTREVVGFEALTRFDDGTPPDLRFKEAAEIGLGVSLEHATVEALIKQAARLPRGLFLSLNVSSALILERETIAFAARAACRPLVLELTEREPVGDYEALARGLAELPNVKLAVDDAGAGYASLRHILALHPSYIKLDITWVRGIEDDTARQALVAGINHFASRTKCRIIAEGVETEPEATVLRRLGIEFGQGFLFGRPAPADDYGSN
jgi:PAS domain S-box-containing protein